MTSLYFAEDKGGAFHTLRTASTVVGALGAVAGGVTYFVVSGGRSTGFYLGPASCDFAGAS